MQVHACMQIRQIDLKLEEMRRVQRGEEQQQACCPHGTLVIIRAARAAARVDSASVPTSCVNIVTRRAPRPTKAAPAKKSAKSSQISAQIAKRISARACPFFLIVFSK